jgi:hypothetical protein
MTTKKNIEYQAGLACTAVHVVLLNPHTKTLQPTANQVLHDHRSGVPILSTSSITFTLG